MNQISLFGKLSGLQTLATCICLQVMFRIVSSIVPAKTPGLKDYNLQKSGPKHAVQSVKYYLNETSLSNLQDKKCTAKT